MATNASNITGFITSVLSQSGSPVVYKLTPKRDKIGHVTKMTLGKKTLARNQDNKTILLCGETGTGKSTLINALINYAMGVTWEDNVWFKIVEEEERNQCESQTSDVMVYEIFGFEGKTLPYSLTIIDTPGYGDIRGNVHDSIVSHRLLELFGTEGGVHELNAVGLVLKADMNRLSDRQNYIFNSVLSLFGRDMAENLVAMVTHSPGTKPENVLGALETAGIKFARNARGQSVYFLFNNCQTTDRGDDPDDSDVLEFADRITMKGMKQFADFLSKSEPKKLQVTVDVLNERRRLNVCIKILKERVEFIKNKQEVIQRLYGGASSSFLRAMFPQIRMMEALTSGWLEESFQHVVRLEQIALNADSLFTHLHLDFLIEMMEERGDAEKIEKLKEIQSRAGFGTKAGMRYAAYAMLES